MTNATPPAGWYPDPFAERWWDGAAWTGEVRDEGQAVTPTTVNDGTPPGWYSDPYSERWWDGLVWTETARSRWGLAEATATGLVPVIAEDGMARRSGWLIGAGVGAAILIGVILALALGGDDRRAEVTVPSTPPAFPDSGPTLPPIITADPTRTTTATPITLGQDTTSVWNTSLAPSSAPLATAPATSAPTAPSTAAANAAPPPATSAPQQASTAPPPATTAPPPATTGAPAAAAGKGVVPASASASCQAPDSYASDGTPVSFGAGNTIDGDPATAWRCSVPATGQTLTLTFAKATRVDSVGLIPGYDKIDPNTGEDRFFENYRVKTVRWHFDDGSSVEQQLQDDRAMQTVRVKAATTTTVVMEILDVYPPSAPVGSSQYRPYVAVSEVAFTGR